MFTSARLKLTLWYLLISTIIITIFSFFIYRQLTAEVDRFAASQRLRIERRYYQGVPLPVPSIQVIDQDLVDDIKHRLLLILLVIDGSILAVAGGLGYFLAGQTLKPISDMVDEQYRFVSDSSHELRTPLTSLKSAMEVSLRDPKLSLSEAKNLIKESIDEVDKLTVLSNNLLKLARFDQAGTVPVFGKVALDSVLQSSIQKLKPISDIKNIHIINQANNFNLKGDQDSLTELMVILLDNAIKYSPSGSEILINSGRHDKQAVIKIRDQGIGIDPDSLPHIFDRFYRADAARTKTDAGGYGLGLSIAKKIIDSHHGEIKVISKVGQGSTFIIRLPLFNLATTSI